MITQIQVDGFKSLSAFRMNLSPGLNVMAGPNGSGKTNIVSFFEFLAHLIESDLSEATSFLGGSGAIQRRVEQDLQTQVIARVFGSYPLDQSDHHPYGFPPMDTNRGKFGFYDFGFTLQFTGELEPVVFAKQHLRFKGSNKFVGHEKIDTESCNWDLDIEMTMDFLQTKPNVKVNKLAKQMQEGFMIFIGPPDAKDTNIQLEQIFMNMMTSGTSLPTVLSRLSPMMPMLSGDIAGGQAFNIIPSRVKLSEDAARQPGIASDGSGLSTTLYALKRKGVQNSTFNLFYSWAPGRRQAIRNTSLDILTNYFQLANKSINNVEITLDKFSNQVRVSFEMKNGPYTANIPLSLMSDGTLKWITLITAALTASSVFSIEEPENYLHPTMQAQCVTLLRDILFQEKKHAAILMTTHSETLLNNCVPSELIIVNFTDGRTVAGRFENESDVSDEIARTGFGLGYYYINNALQND
jgi:predicted ATPase